MSSIDDIATPMEMMMEDTKTPNSFTEPFITPEKPAMDAPSTPTAQTNTMRLSDLLSPQSELSALLGSPQFSPSKRVSFEANPVSPSPRRSSTSYRKRQNNTGNNNLRKPTIPLNVSLADRPTKAWLAKHGQLPGQKDAVMVNSNGKRSADTLFPMDHNKRHKRWHRTVPVESVPNRPTKSWLAKVEAGRAIREKLQQRHGGTNTNTPCPYLESSQTLQTPNGQFFHYGDHQYP